MTENETSHAQMRISEDVMIDMRAVHKWYDQFHVLKDINLTVHKGERIVICGPSGSGKSTLLNIVGLLDRPTAGSYRLNGKDVSGLSDVDQAAVRNTTIGFVFQMFHLVPYLNVLENILVAGGACAGHDRKTRAEQLAEQLGLRQRMFHRPAELSAGEKQRAAIARALLNRPKLILADEPTGNLDLKTGEDIIKLLSQLLNQLFFHLDVVRLALFVNRSDNL